FSSTHSPPPPLTLLPYTTLFRSTALGRRSLIVPADVARADEVARLVRTVEEQLGSIDVLVNNAGVARPQKIEEITEQDWDELIRSEEHTSELQSRGHLVCRLLLE